MNPELPPNPREELEARVTALLLGELSAAEAASMRETIAKDADLGRLRDRLSLTLDLLRETAATPVGETPAQPAALKLSPERREKLLAHFKTIAPKEFAPPPRWKMSWLVPLTAAAAIVLLAALFMPALSKAKFEGQRSASMEYLGVLNRPVAAPAAPPLALRTKLMPLPPSPAAPASQIVLPQNSEQQIAEVNSLNNNGTLQFSDNVGGALQTREYGNREQSGTPPAAPATAATVGGTANFDVDRDIHHVFVTADTTAQPEAGFGGGGGASGISGVTSPVPVTKGPATSGSFAMGDVSHDGSLLKNAQKEKIAMEEALEHWNQLPPPNASLPAPVAAPAPLHAAERMTRRMELPAYRSPTSLSPIPESASSRSFDGRSASVATSDVPMPAPVMTASPPVATAPVAIDSFQSGGRIAGIPSTNANIVADAKPSSTSAAPPLAWSAKEHSAGNIAGEGTVRELVSKSSARKQIEQSDAPLPHPARPAPVPQAEVLTRDNAFTTFSLNVSDVAFKLAAASLQNGAMPEAASMRSEEFINAFDYRDPEPAPGAPIGFAWERAGYPFAHNRDLLRFSIKTAAQGRQAGRPLNLVLLLDKSGSMERADRVEIISQALRVLASQLQPQDTLSVVVFARTARLFVDGVPGSQAGNVAKDLRSLTPEGGTNLEEAMKLAYATALRHYLANGENRVVLLTDGAANLGNVEPDALKRKVETNRKQGIALDCFGVGWDGYNDNLMETLSRAGNGRYGFINTPEEAATEFAGKLAGALRVAAADVKVQVEFNPNRVTSYRQIGYAKDQLKKEDFRDNSVRAAQIGAAESGNALYTVEINPAGEGPLGTVHVRFRVPGTADYQEHEWTVPYTGSAVPLDKASPAMRLTATAAAFCEWLAGSPYAGEVTPDRLLVYLNGVPQVYGADTRPAKLQWMIRQAKSISGK